MMMRSAPAVSAHLAEIPVPAPAPSMGTPAALLARHFSRHVDRSIMLFFSLAALAQRLLYDCSMPTPKEEELGHVWRVEVASREDVLSGKTSAMLARTSGFVAPSTPAVRQFSCRTAGFLRSL